MKNIQLKAILIVVGVTLCLPSLIKAQNSIAKIDMNQLFEEHPEKDEYYEKFDELNQEYNQELQDMSNKLMKTLDKYSDEADSQSEETNAERAKEVQIEKDKIAQYRDDAMEDLNEEEAQLIEKISNDIRTAVSNVAKKQNLDFVINTSSEYNIINADCKNIFDDAKAELVKICAEREERINNVINSGFK